MCGIVGVLGLEDKNLISKMLDLIKYRGPDDRGIYVGNNVSIGHVRLSIIDLSVHGRNPLFNEDESIFIVYNGEIYNFQALKDYLEKHGHIFRSKTDSEVIVHAYEEWGIDCVKKFNGMFAFALFDTNKKVLYLVRDHFGIKPLFYSNQNNLFFFSSELKALLENEYITPKISKLGLYYCLSFLNTPPPFTLFKDIKKLPPGHYLEINSKKKLKLIKYYDLNNNPDNISESIDAVLQKGAILLRNSIDRMRYSDVKQGVFLSGGLDSSSIVALLNEIESKPIETFSIGISGFNDIYNELKWAQIIHEKFGTNHHEYLFDVNSLITLLQEYLNNQYDFTADPGCLLTYQLSKMASKNNIKVVHVGEGADEIYCGYKVYFEYLKNLKLRYCYNQFPSIVKKSLYLYLREIMNLINKSSHLLIDQEKLFNDYLNSLDRLNADWLIPHRSIMGFHEILKKIVLNDNCLVPKDSKFHIYNILKSLDRNSRVISKEESFLQDIRYLEFKIRIPESILMRVDNYTMLSSIEARVPYFDKYLLEYNMSLLPLKIHHKNSILKFVLKSIMKNKLPKETINRKKVGLATPNFFDKKLIPIDIIETEFSKSYMKDYFKEDFLKKIINKKSFKQNFSNYQLWSIAQFSFLYRKIILKEKIVL